MNKKYTKEQIEKELEQAWDEYENKVSKIATKAFNTHVKPFCKKRNWEFAGGMGAYWIGNKVTGYSEYPEDRPNDKVFAKLTELLDLPIEGLSANVFGSLMPEYRKEDTK
jgi:hypothetical protein